LNDPNIGSVKKSGLSTGAKVGIGVGVPLGVLAVLFAAFLLWRRRRRSRGAGLATTAPGHLPRDDDPKMAVVAREAPVLFKPELAANHTFHPVSGTRAELGVAPHPYHVDREQRSELGSSPPPRLPAHLAPGTPVLQPALEVDHSSTSPEVGFSDLPESIAGGAVPAQSGGDDPVLAQLDEEERRLHERRERLNALERLDYEQRELQRRREERLRQLR
jgi:hypothetical protein